MIFADSPETGSAFWVIIIGAIFTGISSLIAQCFNIWLTYKNRTLQKETKAMVQDNTEKTEATQKLVNGRVEQLVKTAEEKGHAEGVLKGKSDLKSAK